MAIQPPPEGNLVARWNQLGLQDALSPVMEEFLFFHDFVITVLVFAVTVVGYVIVSLLGNRFINQGPPGGQALECIWTLVPALILIQVALPCLTLLYILDETSTAAVTLKAVGHQWYWSYELGDFQGGTVEFDAYIVPTTDLAENGFRLLETDNRPLLPYRAQIRVLVRRADVLHSWAVPSLGVKADANPGRLNQAKFVSLRPGMAYGQCSEICGANHSFIPISLEFVRGVDFLSWVAAVGE